MRTEDPPGGLGDVLFSPGRRRVLEVLFGNPHRAYYFNELLRLTAPGKAGLKRDLAALTRVGILEGRKVGNQMHYRANDKSPIFEDLRSIVRKTFGLAEPLRESLSRLGDSVSAAFIYGSVAKGTDTAESDIDVFVLSDALDNKSLIEALQPCEDQLRRKISTVLYSSAELRSKLAERASFITRIIAQEKIPLIGDINAVVKFGEPGQDGAPQEGTPGPSGI